VSGRLSLGGSNADLRANQSIEERRLPHVRSPNDGYSATPIVWAR
jgi:hypothetical protein